jgi:hypothetical protein
MFASSAAVKKNKEAIIVTYVVYAYRSMIIIALGSITVSERGTSLASFSSFLFY